MLLIFPFLAWLAALTSLVLLIMLWTSGELGSRGVAVLLAWFVLAAYCQFVVSSAIVGALGLLSQTILAIVLVLRWRLNG